MYNFINITIIAVFFLATVWAFLMLYLIIYEHYNKHYFLKFTSHYSAPDEESRAPFVTCMRLVTVSQWWWVSVLMSHDRGGTDTT